MARTTNPYGRSVLPESRPTSRPAIAEPTVAVNPVKAAAPPARDFASERRDIDARHKGEMDTIEALHMNKRIDTKARRKMESESRTMHRTAYVRLAGEERVDRVRAAHAKRKP